ncbi:hypothetical protein C8J57DRAFT_585395 [Mycena rebaudengoi]|nr:hypothetical protein C8J57DRAFT_585395 [Mycena rebaudengoi]
MPFLNLTFRSFLCILLPARTLQKRTADRIEGLTLNVAVAVESVPYVGKRHRWPRVLYHRSSHPCFLFLSACIQGDKKGHLASLA